VRRISGRRTCGDCGRVFNVLTSPPSGAAAVCPTTGAPHRLTQRADDNEATVAERLRVYAEKTRPLMEFYRKRGILRVINAEGQVDAVAQRLADALTRAPAAAAAARVRKSAAKRARPKSAARSKARRSRAARGGARQPKSARRKAPARAARKSSRGGPGAKRPNARRAARRRTRR
jgi:hypothetical protein